MQIPTIGPGGAQLETISPNVRRERISTQGKGMEVIGGAVSNVSDALYAKMDEARNFTEASQAELYANQKMGELLLKSETDTRTTPDGKTRLLTGRPEDFTSYNDAIMQGREEVKKFFTNREQQEKFLAEYDKTALLTRNKIQATFMKNMIAEGKASLAENIDTLSNAYAMSGNPQLLDKIGLTVDEAIAKGFYDPKEGYDLKNKYISSAIEWAIYNDNSTEESQSSILAKLKDTQNPVYKNLGEADRLELIKKSQQRIFQNNQTFKRVVEISQNERNDSFIDKLATGTATFKDIDSEFAVPEDQGGIKRETLLQYQRGLQSRVAKDLNVMLQEKIDKEPTKRAKQVKAYNDLIDMFIDDEGDHWKAKEALAKAWADGTIDAREAKVLNPLQSNLRDIQFNRNTGFIAIAIKAVKRFMKDTNASDEELAISIKQLLGGIGEGEQPQVMMKKIMDSEMRKHFPDYTTFSKEGKTYMDNMSGRQYKVFPDGSWAWVEQKNISGSRGYMEKMSEGK